MSRLVRPTVALAAALLASVARGGDAPLSPTQIDAAFVSDARRTFEPFRGKLEALGEWCGTSSLFLQRSRIAETLVAFDPDHDRARGWLRFKRRTDGSWQQTSARPFADDNLEALPEWRKRRSEVEDPIRAALLPLFDGPRWETAAGRTWLLRALVAMTPEDEALRSLAGETQSGKRWVLKETAATAAGRRAVQDAVGKAVRSVPPTKLEHPSPPAGWLSASKTDVVSVTANVHVASADDIAVRSAQAVALARLVLGDDMRPPKDLQIFVLGTPNEAPGFLARRAAQSPADREFLTRTGGVDYLAKQGGFWISLHEYGCSMWEHPHRVDSVVREVLNSMSAPSCGPVYAGPPWLFEGAGMYLTYALVGTRLTTLHEKSSYSNQDDMRALSDAKADWCAVLRGMVEKGFDPRLPAVLTSPLNSLTKEDGLVAYALAAYFLEGRGRDLRALLDRTRAGASMHQAVAEVCGTDVAGLQERFLRWLRETK